MGKMTSLLEKYKLIEKEDDGTSFTSSSHIPETSQETPIDDALLSTPSVSEVDSAEPQVQMISSTIEKTEVETPSTYIAPETTSNEESAPLVEYNQLLTLNDIYNYLKLNQVAATDTVFLLENLIKALPEELPEFVKKTTVNNIIEASAMNLSKLLEDGRVRSQSLQQFATNYTQTHTEDISALKTEISRLSAIIADYHQQIKHKETLIAEETNLIQTEQQRIQSILEFFSN
ncbi:MAG: hypothetical protein J6F30_16650 [Cellulosilyticum sp.]|nr:hypothetical protein [Cellulosilyticum sp.]